MVDEGPWLMASGGGYALVVEADAMMEDGNGG